MYKCLRIALVALASLSVWQTARSANSLFEETPVSAFALADVTVTSPTITHVQMLAKDYILGLDADRLLAPYFKEAGLAPMAENYSNWENTGLDGHIGGHYLSALAHMYAATGDPRIKERLSYTVGQLAKIQGSDGYLCGVPGGRAMWREVASGHIDAGAFSLNGKWVPLYNIHKVMAGLRDAYLVGGDADAKIVFLKLCGWFEANFSKLSDSQIQTMLVSEYGGLNEIMADAYSITGQYKYLDLAKRLTHKVIIDPLLEGEDRLSGIHANTQIPKIIGVERISQVGHDADFHKAADFFWHTVTENRSVSIGGNSVREHFHPADDFSSMIESEQGPETCNTYNMLRLTKLLFLDSPDATYADFYERAMLNHILSSINSVQGGFVYFTPMRPGHYRVYSQPQTSFWCCVGSGIENHSRYGELIYAHKGADVLYVNTFLSSKLQWKANRTEVELTGHFPWSDHATAIISSNKPRRWTLKVRKPEWSDDFTVSVGNSSYTKAGDDGFIAIEREWAKSDTVRISMPMKLKSAQLPDGSDYYSFTYGPMVLAADLGSADQVGVYADDSRGGHIAGGPKMDLTDVPMFVTNDDPASHLHRKDGNWEWAADCIMPSKYASVRLVPFVNLSEHRYQIYFRKLSKDDYENKVERLRLIEEARKELEAKTVDVVTCGEQQPESDHSFAQGSSRAGGDDGGRHWRETDSWFSYVLNIKTAQKISVSYMQMPGRSAIISCGRSSIELTPGEEGFRTIEMPIEQSSDGRLAVKVVALRDGEPSPRIYEVRAVK